MTNMRVILTQLSVLRCETRIQHKKRARSLGKSYITKNCYHVVSHRRFTLQLLAHHDEGNFNVLSVLVRSHDLYNKVSDM